MCASCGAANDGRYRCTACTRNLVVADGASRAADPVNTARSSTSAAIFWGLGASVHAAWQLVRYRQDRGLPTKGWAAGVLVFTALPVLGVFVFSAVYGGLPWTMVLGAVVVITMLAALSTLLVRLTSRNETSE
ncbi:MAG: hypothetical protein QOG53_2512 [Frankiales bacterium]|nr:hypothetical protein [Frankiales bacterium]